MRTPKHTKKEKTIRSYEFSPEVIQVIDDVYASHKIKKISFVEEAILIHAREKYGIGNNSEKSDLEHKVNFLLSEMFSHNKVKREFQQIQNSDDEETQEIFSEILSLYKENSSYVEKLNILAALGSDYKRLKDCFSERDLYIIALAINYGIYRFPKSKAKTNTSSKE